MNFIYISKLDSASRQLRTAVRMFLQNGEPVSIHVLGCAAQEILESLCKSQGIKSLKLQMVDLVRPEMKAKFTKISDEAKNSFKHAGRDPKAITKFNPEISEFVLWDAVRLHHYLTSEKDPLFVAFNLWIYAKHPDIFSLDSEQKGIYDALTKGFDYNNRGLFLQMVPVFEQATKM
jgi:hypothetical protein